MDETAVLITILVVVVLIFIFQFEMYRNIMAILYHYVPEASPPSELRLDTSFLGQTKNN